jgi:hypothetical protein
VLNFKHKGVYMTLQEQTIKEIKELSPQSLTMIYNHIRLLKQAQTVYSKKRHTAPYLKARKILSMCKVSLSEDIITDREDRI